MFLVFFENKLKWVFRHWISVTQCWKKIQAIFSKTVPVLKWSVTIWMSVTLWSVTIMSVYNTLNSSSALNREYVENFDIAFLPLLNPDGYEWSEFSVQNFFNHFFYRFSIIKIYKSGKIWETSQFCKESLHCDTWFSESLVRHHTTRFPLF